MDDAIGRLSTTLARVTVDLAVMGVERDQARAERDRLRRENELLTHALLATKQALLDVQAARDALRDRLARATAALAPLLWEPHRTVYRLDGPPDRECCFCASRQTAHADDCPVLHRAELLDAAAPEA